MSSTTITLCDHCKEPIIQEHKWEVTYKKLTGESLFGVMDFCDIEHMVEYLNLALAKINESPMDEEPEDE